MITLRNAEYVKSRLMNKDSCYRTSVEYIFWLLHQKFMRKLKAGIVSAHRRILRMASVVCVLLISQNMCV